MAAAMSAPIAPSAVPERVTKYRHQWMQTPTHVEVRCPVAVALILRSSACSIPRYITIPYGSSWWPFLGFTLLLINTGIAQILALPIRALISAIQTRLPKCHMRYGF